MGTTTKGFTSASAAGVTIAVNESLCKGCEICVNECPTDVFEMSGEGSSAIPVPERPDDCVDCGKCELLCPDFALEVRSDG
jgi:2-oxoglutarate ferredoxin oxidoreductase subunit delta